MTQYDEIRQDVALCTHPFINKNKCVICGVKIEEGTADYIKKYRKIDK